MGGGQDLLFGPFNQVLVLLPCDTHFCMEAKKPLKASTTDDKKLYIILFLVIFPTRQQ